MGTRANGEKVLNSDCENLNGLLRCELTAVNQQFIHVLALRDWGFTETAERIMEVDYVDFPNAMRIIDYLVQARLPVLLPSERPTPGTTYNGILLSEHALEQRLFTAIEEAVCTNDHPRALVSAARAPREAYAAWLTDQLDGSGTDEGLEDTLFPESLGVFAHLIATIEQAMVHAFVHWYEGQVENADGAWATSGAAMMHAAEFVHLFAAEETLPLSGEMPALQIASESAAALDFDRRLAGRCAREAAQAADACNDRGISDLCRRIARYSLQLSGWKPGDTHPAAKENPAAFSSFDGTLRKFVQAAD
jgi:bacterioferritin (cytochrome b1)